MWHPYRRDENDDEVTHELQAACLAPDATGKSPTRNELLSRWAEFRALVRDAEDGALLDESWDRVCRNPDLWELRWQWTGSKVLVRAYFHEPNQPFDRTVVAKVHVKEIVRGREDLTKEKQNQCMDTASLRVAVGRPNEWGLSPAAPLCPRGPHG